MVHHFGIIVNLMVKGAILACAKYGYVIFCASRQIELKVEVNGTIKYRALISILQ